MRLVTSEAGWDVGQGDHLQIPSTRASVESLEDLIQMLRSTLTCANGCFGWSSDEENRAQVFPYHGCALPTELGGRVLSVQLASDIAAAMLMKGPHIGH